MVDFYWALLVVHKKGCSVGKYVAVASAEKAIKAMKHKPRKPGTLLDNEL